MAFSLQHRKSKSLSDQLRKIIEHGPLTRYRISKDSGVDASQLLRFVHGRGKLTTDTPFSRGDINLDHDVDTRDLTAMIIGFISAGGTGKTWNTGDTDGDGDVDSTDLTRAIINFTGASNAAAAVPEPSSLRLLVLAARCLAATRGRSCRNV